MDSTPQHHDDRKMFAAIGCLFIGFLFVWNIAAHITDIYELRLDAEACNRVKTLGLAPSADCIVTAPFRQAAPGIPAGFLVLPDGSELQVSPLAAKETGRSAAWTPEMKTQFVMALIFWGATFVLLLGAFRNRE